MIRADDAGQEMSPQLGSLYCKHLERCGQQVFTPRIAAAVCGAKGQFGSIFVCGRTPPSAPLAGVAQLVEQLICNHQVVGSSPITGSILTPSDTATYKKRKTDASLPFSLVGLNVGLFDNDFRTFYRVSPMQKKNLSAASLIYNVRHYESQGFFVRFY